MATAEQDFHDAFNRILRECTLNEALSIATGVFVGLVVSATEEAGHDSRLEITVDGGESRDITLHPVKA